MNVWEAVVGQPAAVATLQRAAAAPVHAYLFIGPSGSTKSEAARAFAATLLGADERTARLVMAGQHTDVREVERVGPAIEATGETIVELASLAPVEGERKVVILHEFHLVSRSCGGAPQDHRGAAGVDLLRRAGRHGASRARHDRFTLCAGRVCAVGRT